MRVLLDTHLLLWALGSPSKLSKKARQRINSSEVFASAASIWEISIKYALGKLEANPAAVLAGIEPAGFSHLTIVGEHAAKVVHLPPIHKDPFDRLLVAQAWVEPMILLTNDDVLGGYGDFVEVI
jgi:PIN domain nuclease of toxin-antitoxin system